MTSTLAPTPGQTVGPFFHYALPFVGDSMLVSAGHDGAIRLHGTVFDGAGEPVNDALVEIWQADADGRVVQQAGSLHRDGWTFTGWGRCATDGAGQYTFSTVAPGPTEPGQAPFFAVTVFARGLLHRLLTRAYLPGHPGLHTDALLATLEPERRETLIATTDAAGLIFDIHLQGPHETVFLSHASRSQAGSRE